MSTTEPGGPAPGAGAPTGPTAPPTRLPRALAPLATPAYRWLLLMLTCSLAAAGLWMLSVVWQVVALGGGPTAVSLVSTGFAVGMLATALLGGVLADRVPQRRILLVVALTELVAVGTAAALALLGVVAVWHLGVASLAIGVAQGLAYPAYSALLPSLLPADRLLAANGLEGVLRPLLVNAGGPAVAGLVVAAWSPGAALLLAAVACAGAVVGVAGVPPTPLRRDLAAEAAAAGGRSPVAGLLADVVEGFRYMVRTPWLLATLLFASLLVLVVMGPLEVLTPFAVRDRAGGGPAEHALVLAAFGVGGAVASVVVASRRLPRRYLTWMNLLWGVGCVPFVLFGLTTSLLVMALAAAVVGATFQGATVIWGTLLQRRVPPALLGRVSSLDFFVSLSLMPVSMALAGPVSEAVGLTPVFLVAGLVPPVVAVVAIRWARLHVDELEHPLDVPAEPPGVVPSPPGPAATGTAPVAGEGARPEGRTGG
ncbi:MFS transporter [Pseudokineococcus lusitanus]|uniref:Putative MFS family arabinose efflux permease n=1 Tax=Pseudokineococcus lusitanus TaxID=763993 RepID=A0A3N1HR86_9ACTN|nr:MFS transporter [Pseudokineococcus lusitanus]ROP45034.1 putative MFS family arabinose efflux permease [Pseudokineococcus lusitanus]